MAAASLSGSTGAVSSSKGTGWRVVRRWCSQAGVEDEVGALFWRIMVVAGAVRGGEGG
jgi:hypothetical protein